MGIYIPREAVVMLELIGTRLTVQTKASVPGVRLRPDQVEGVKALLHVFTARRRNGEKTS